MLVCLRAILISLSPTERQIGGHALEDPERVLSSTISDRHHGSGRELGPSRRSGSLAFAALKQPQKEANAPLLSTDKFRLVPRRNDTSSAPPCCALSQVGFRRFSCSGGHNANDTRLQGFCPNLPPRQISNDLMGTSQRARGSITTRVHKLLDPTRESRTQ